jgi:hypothetical protein
VAGALFLYRTPLIIAGEGKLVCHGYVICFESVGWLGGLTGNFAGILGGMVAK